MPLVYSNVVYAVIFFLAFIVSFISELIGPAGHRARQHKQKDSSLIVLNVAAATGTLLFFLLPLLVSIATTRQPLLFVVGLVVLCLGMALRRYAMATLGVFFVGIVLIQTDHQVIQSGPYKFIRHPAYSGILIGAIGNGLMMENWASLTAIVLGMTVGLYFRIRAEEKVLESIPAYREYRRRVKWRVIPFIL